MKTKKEVEEMPEVTVNRYAEGKASEIILCADWNQNNICFFVDVLHTQSSIFWPFYISYKLSIGTLLFWYLYN